jgi:hypothetical protein
MSIEKYRENRRADTGDGGWDARNGIGDLMDVPVKDLMLEFIKVDCLYDAATTANEDFLRSCQEEGEYLNEKLKQMQELYDDIEMDTENKHRCADEVLCQLVISLGGSKGLEIVNLYQNINKWYA